MNQAETEGCVQCSWLELHPDQISSRGQTDAAFDRQKVVGSRKACMSASHRYEWQYGISREKKKPVNKTQQRKATVRQNGLLDII